MENSEGEKTEENYNEEETLKALDFIKVNHLPMSDLPYVLKYFRTLRSSNGATDNELIGVEPLTPDNELLGVEPLTPTPPSSPSNGQFGDDSQKEEEVPTVEPPQYNGCKKLV